MNSYKLYINKNEFLENILLFIKNNNIIDTKYYRKYLYSTNGIYNIKNRKIIKNKIIENEKIYNDLKVIVDKLNNDLCLDTSYLIECEEIFNLPKILGETNESFKTYYINENILFVEKIEEFYLNNNENENKIIKYYYFEILNKDNLLNFENIIKILYN